MKNLMLISIVSLVAVGCASTTPRDKWSDKNLRVMIDPDSVDAKDYVRIQQAFFKSDKFFVVDRNKGFKAVKKEQNRLHREEVDRYEDREKWAHWGKLYGVGAIVTGHTQCRYETTFFGNKYQVCLQNLAMIDANTGEVIAASENTSRSEDSYDNQIVPPWDETVDQLISAYPKKWRSKTFDQRIRDYQDLSKEEAVRQQEGIAKRELANEE